MATWQTGPMTPRQPDSFPFPRFPSFPTFHSKSSPLFREKREDPSPPLSPLSMPKQLEWVEVSRRRVAIATVLAMLVFIWLLQHSFKTGAQKDRIPLSPDAVEDYLVHFDGHQDCAITSSELYQPPKTIQREGPKHSFFCHNRQRLLEAMSEGGRHGFDAPYSPAGCHYRWYTAPEICMILERFDALVFVGDDMLKHIYLAFNMIMRENVAMGGLMHWQLSDSERDTCRCDNQIIKPECAKHAILQSDIVGANEGGGSGHASPYLCDSTPHFFLPIAGSPADDEHHDRFVTLLKSDPDSYKPIPVIHALGLSTSLSWSDATASMDEWVSLADTSSRNVPFLWIGPNAAGHRKPPGQILSQGNNALWHYTLEMAKEAHSRELDALGMYNLTLQANSWDGSGYGLRVTLVQAMMVINWLARVEST